FALGWLRVLGERAQLYDSAFGAALMVTQSLVIFVALVWRAAVQLNRADAERLRAEEALRRSHEELETKVAARTDELRFRSHLLDTAEQAVIATDLGGQIIYWNSFAEKLYGWPATEAVGRNIVEITPAAESLAQSTEIMNRLSRGQSWAGEFNVRRRDGTIFPAQVTDTPILDAAGQLVGIVGVSNDISARKQAERERESLLARERNALAEVERRLRESDQLTALYRELTGALALHEVTAAICRAVRAIVGADGAAFVLGEGEEVYYADENAITPLWQGRRFPVAACVSGWSIIERQPVIIEDIYADPRVPLEAYRATFVKGMLMIPVRAANPVAAIGAYWGTPHHATDDELRLMRALANAADLALSNSQLYEQMQRAQLEAETASRLKDDFLATVSHELRTPMTAILGWAHLLQAGTLDEAMHGRALKTIERNAQAQAQLIEDLLDVSRIITGKLRLDVRPVALAPIIAAAAEAVRPAADA
ncbi:MAG TPA: PAS domain S-box protein, partial [Pyrinomonadaceae bacterium]|nr:PAS domain S-box protein [Pyrinomonadaceae bacterium]